MQPFTVLSGVAANLRINNIDTDVIIPVAWVKNSVPDIAAGLFGRWRYTSGEDIERTVENPEFILNRDGFRQTRILLAAKNFGCGSSREHAVWALAGFGIRCIIAESFADIFFSNCFKNGVLPIQLEPGILDALAHEVDALSPQRSMTVDLVHCRITSPAGQLIEFRVDPPKRDALLRGLDPIGATLVHADAIETFQQADALRRPWIYRPGAGAAED
jgi:3-isopropylmalate/(R)-2-methylmalate dehydratase small subunit